MSYEGSIEFLCEKGHRSVIDCHEAEPSACRCGAPLTYTHAIDYTNGEDADDPSTFPASRVEIGFDDIWKTDHYDNHYAIKDVRYAPLDNWIAIKTADGKVG